MRPIIIINEIPFLHIENNVTVGSNKIDINQNKNFPWELVISNR